MRDRTTGEKGERAVNANDPGNAYREIQIKTANQIRLIVMLYDGAIKRINLALDLFAEGHKRYDAINGNVIAAQDILSELMASLDFDKGGVLAKNLFSLYSFMNRRLLDGNLKKDPAPLREVRKLLGELREAWDEISTRKGLEETTNPATGVNIAG
jgi:flagellar protein FliS